MGLLTSCIRYSCAQRILDCLACHVYLDDPDIRALRHLDARISAQASLFKSAR